MSTHVPPITPATPASPFAKGRYFRGRISEGIDWTIEMVASVVPMRIPPPINIDMLVALAQMMEPMHAISGGMVANNLRSKTQKGDRQEERGLIA